MFRALLVRILPIILVILVMLGGGVWALYYFGFIKLTNEEQITPVTQLPPITEEPKESSFTIDPQNALSKERNEARKAHLAAFKKALEDFAVAKNKYPAKLEELKDYFLGGEIPKDPGTGLDYEYTSVIEWSFEFCVTLEINQKVCIQPAETGSFGVKRARDVQRESDLKEIQTALELFKVENKEYPEFLYLLSDSFSKKEVPKDPFTDKSYEYSTSNLRSKYSVCAFMEIGEKKCLESL